MRNEEILSVGGIVSAGYEFHHRATRMGYTRADEIGVPVPYKGRYGAGYVVPAGRHVKSNGRPSSQYEDIDYYIKKEN